MFQDSEINVGFTEYSRVRIEQNNGLFVDLDADLEDEVLEI